MFPAQDKPVNTRLAINDAGDTDTLYTGVFDQSGKIGLHLELGRHHFVDHLYLLDNIDYGLGFKMLRGAETFEGRVKTDSALVAISNEGTFGESFVTGFVNLGNIYQISDNTFLHNSLGLNLDYRVINKREMTGLTNGMIQSFPPNFLAQFHYRLGFGFKMSASWFIVPSAETPVLTLVKFDDGKSTMQYFSSRYRPLIFTLRIMRLDKRKSADCVGKSAGTTGHQLWDKKMSKKRGRR